MTKQTKKSQLLEQVKEMAKSQMFEISESVLSDFEEFFEKHLQSIEKLSKINVAGVSPMAYPDESPKAYLRPDVVDKATHISREHLLANAKSTKNGEVCVPRAVKND